MTVLRLTRNTGWNDDNIGTGQDLLLCLDCLLLFTRKVALCGDTSGNLCDRGNVREISTNAWGVDDIEETKFVNVGRNLAEEGERLRSVVSTAFLVC